MNTVNDFEQIKERLSAFWAGEAMDRPAASIMCPAANPKPYIPPVSVEQKWLDAAYRVKSFADTAGNYEYHAEAFPLFCVNLGPCVLANFVGSDYKLDETTVWFDRNPMIKDINRREKLRFDEQSIMWQTLLEITKRAAPHAGKDFLLGLTDFGGALDIAGALLGAEELYCLMYDEPEALTALCDEIDDVWIELFNKQNRINDELQSGYCTWQPMWKSTPWYPLQCDLSVSISADMFEKFALNSLRRLAKAVGGSTVYHLDGYAEHIHLDHILSIPEIVAIEWVPNPKGAWLNHYDKTFFSMYKKIQDSGRRLIMRAVDPAIIEPLFEVIDPRGVYIATWANSTEEALDIEKRLKKVMLKNK